MEYYVRYVEGMERCRFKAGDIVLITGYYEHRTKATGAVGTISGVQNTYATYDCIEYCVVIEGNDVKDAIVVNEDYISLATPKEVIEFDDNAFYDKPLFQLGDVVSAMDDVYVVSDIVNMISKEDSRYVYELSPIGLGTAAK